jgi:hypothetical protein
MTGHGATPVNMSRHTKLPNNSINQDFFAAGSVMLPETARTAGINLPGSMYNEDDDTINESFNLISK